MSVLKIPARKSLFEWIYSTISRKLFLGICLKLRFTPNQVTLFSGLCGVVGAYMLSSGSLGMAFALVNIYALLDLVDGDIARSRKMQSSFGYWLDIFFDKLIDALLVIATVHLVYQSNNSMTIGLLGCALMASVFFNQFVLLLNDTTFRSLRVSGVEKNNSSDDFPNSASISVVKFLKLHFSLNHNAFLFFVVIYPMLLGAENGFYVLCVHSIATLLSNALSNFVIFRGK